MRGVTDSMRARGQSNHAKGREDRRCSDCMLARVVGHVHRGGERFVRCAADYWPIALMSQIPDGEAANCELFDDADEDPTG